VRDVALLLFVLAAVPMALVSPFAAFMLWTWAGLAAINYYVYGFMQGTQLAQIFALIALGLILFGRVKELKKYQLNGTGLLLLIFVVHGLFSALLAYPGLPRNWELYTNVLKTVLLCLAMPLFLTDRSRINLFVLLVVLSISFHGLLDGLKFLASGGGHNAQGLQKFGDNNHYALVLLMVMPLFIYVYRYATHWLLRYSLVGAFLLTFLAIIATGSRGALLGVVAMGVWVIATGKRKLAGLLMAGVLAILTFQLAPADWFARMDTIKSAQDDSSFMGRVAAWKRASAIALAHPVFGGGFHAGQGAGMVYEKYRHAQGLLGFVDTPDFGYAAASHSIYFEVLGDLGFVGLLLFLVCIARVFYLRGRLLALARGQPQLEWARELGNLIAAGMVVYAVSGALLSAAYFELPYYLMMLIQVLYLVAQNAAHSVPPAAARAGAAPQGA